MWELIFIGVVIAAAVSSYKFGVNAGTEGTLRYLHQGGIILMDEESGDIEPGFNKTLLEQLHELETKVAELEYEARTK